MAATLTANPFEPLFWALMAVFGLCWVVLMVQAAVRRRSEAQAGRSVDDMHVHFFSHDKKLQRRCLICGAQA